MRWGRVVGGLVLAVLLVVATAGGVFVYQWRTSLVDTTGKVSFDKALEVPPLAVPTITDDGTLEFDLALQSGLADFGHGPVTRTWGVNGAYLGPTVRAERGDTVRVNVRNELGEVSTLHWHGMHLPAAMDGGPHQQIQPGSTWSPQWTIDQPAASLWYHPHMHGSTASHVYRGLAGMFIVDDPSGPALPNRYGIDDIPLIVQDKKFDGAQLDEDPSMFQSSGVLGDVVLVNGTPTPHLDVTTERVRLRLLNASNARIYNFGFDSGLAFDVIGTDGGLLPAPVRSNDIRLSPGERAEIVVEVAAGESTVLRSSPADLGTDGFNKRFSGGDDSLDVLELRAAHVLESNAEIPDSLSPAPDFGQPEVTRKIELTSATQINGRSMDMSRVDEVIEVDTTELWEVHNATGQVHNFHIHDVQFRIENAPPTASGLKDTVFVPPGGTVRLLMRFTDYADPTTPYMYHCHLLRHEDQGMMGQFVVIEPGDTPRLSPLDHGDGPKHHH